MIKTRIKIHNYYWTIVYRSLDDVEDRPCGIADRSNKVIYINSDYPAETRNTIIHELTHAFVSEYGFWQAPMTFENHAEFTAAYLDDLYLTTNKIEKDINSQLVAQKLKGKKKQDE